jgi:hypothetical protein
VEEASALCGAEVGAQQIEGWEENFAGINLPLMIRIKGEAAGYGRSGLSTSYDHGSSHRDMRRTVEI